jgi:ubiquinone/menaquinone biosynthesis C-methylase UbiE
MSVLVLDGDLLPEVLGWAGDEEIYVVDPSAGRLEQLERDADDPRVFYLIGEAPILPLPDDFVRIAVGDGVEPELGRVLLHA